MVIIGGHVVVPRSDVVGMKAHRHRAKHTSFAARSELSASEVAYIQDA